MPKATYTKAKYRKLKIQEHQDNPVISALPDKITPKRLKELLDNRIQPQSNIGLDKADRILEVKRFSKTRIATKAAWDLYHAVYHLIIQGYESRNPTNPEVVEWSYGVADPDMSIEELRESHKSTIYDEATTTEHLILTGLSGLGKTWIKDSVFFLTFPTLIKHTRSEFDEIQIVHLHIEMPHDGARGTLLKNIIKSFDEALKGVEETNYFKMAQPSLSRPATIGAMESFVQDLCVRYHVGVIIVDEFQNINVSSKGERDKILQLFDSLSNNLKVPFVKIGTPDSMRFFTQRLRHGRRAGEILEMLPYPKGSRSEVLQDKSATKGHDWNNFIDALFDFQIVDKPITYSERWNDELYKLSFGIPYVLFTLWKEAQIDAIRSGAEKLTIRQLNVVYKKRFKLIRTALNALKKNKFGQFQDLLTVNQLIDKGEHEVALKHLYRFANEECFSGTAAIQLLDVVAEMDASFDLSSKQRRLLDQVKSKLEIRAQPVKAGQTIEHDKS